MLKIYHRKSGVLMLAIETLASAVSLGRNPMTHGANSSPGADLTRADLTGQNILTRANQITGQTSPGQTSPGQTSSFDTMR